MLAIGTYLALIEDDEEQRKFESIYHAYRYRMYYICCDILKDEHLAEDALQEAFITIIRRLKRIEHIESNQTACYVLLIAKCRAIDLYRKVKKDYQREFPVEDYGLMPYEILHDVIEKENCNEIIVAICSLRPLNRQILELYLEKKMTRKEIAILLNLKYDTVRKRIQVALSELREELHKRGIYE